jgi:hypothetical protein
MLPKVQRHRQPTPLRNHEEGFSDYPFTPPTPPVYPTRNVNTEAIKQPTTNQHTQTCLNVTFLQLDPVA